MIARRWKPALIVCITAAAVLFAGYRYSQTDVIFYSASDGRIEFPSGVSFPLNRWSDGWKEHMDAVSIAVLQGKRGDLLIEEHDDDRFATLVIDGVRYEAIVERDESRYHIDGYGYNKIWVRPGRNVSEIAD